MKRTKKLRGFVLYEGPSMLDGSPIVAIATRGSSQKNGKTGALVQTYIMRDDVSPLDAAKTGRDVSICGNCEHRKVNSGTCYVRVEQGPTIVWKAYKRGVYPKLHMNDIKEQLAGEKVRLGTYGDAVAVPFVVWKHALQDMAGATGYTHQWKNPLAISFQGYCMASCDSAEETTQARALGWRTFTIVPTNQIIDKAIKSHAFLCPASEEAGKLLTCLECMACGGSSSKNSASVFIPVHGARFKQVRFNNLLQIERKQANGS